MSSAEYRELKEQMDRIERMLSRLTGAGPQDVGSVSVVLQPGADFSGEDMPDADRVRTAQAEGQYILETQGFEAYQEFWKQQGKKRRSKLRKAA